MLIAQLTDLHVKAGRRLAYGRVDTAQALEAAVRHVNGLYPRPDAALVTGDLVDTGGLDEYAAVRPILDALAMPYFVIPGNHDDARTMQWAFADRAYVNPNLDHLSYAIEGFPLRLIGLDTSRPGAPAGYLPDDRAQWLDETLAARPSQLTMLFLHHPPFAIGIRHMDVQNLLDADRLFKVLARHPQVLHVAAGHKHRAVETVIAGIGCSIAPAPAHAVSLDFDPAAPPSYVLEPPMLRLFRFADGRIVLHLSPIGTFDGPHPFFMADGSLIN